MTADKKERIYAEAAFAMHLIERWGMIAATPDGEDSAGRAKLRPLSATEVVDRACDVSSTAFMAFRLRGWLETDPTT